MFDTFFYEPIYNLMVWLSNYLPDFGWVVIITTIIIKIILFPFFTAQIKNQIATKKAQPELKVIQEKLKDKSLDPLKRQALMMEMFQVNKKYGVKFLSPILNLILTMTILIALYIIIYKGGFPKIDKKIIYDFIETGNNIKMTFLNYFDLEKPSYILAFLAGITQYLYMTASMPDVKLSDLKNTQNHKKKIKKEDLGNMKEDFFKSFQVYMKYGLPVMIFIFGIQFKASLTLYWITSNLFMYFQEKAIRSQKDELNALKTN